MKKVHKKIFNLEELKKKISAEKKKGKKIVLCHGVFDLLHVGHIKHFKSAKKSGDFLLVSITSDQFVNKGPGRPVFNHNLRSEAISSLECVDAVFINNFQTPVNLIKLIKPNIYFKGPDYKDIHKDRTKNIIREIQATKKGGGNVMFSQDMTFSSSSLINNHYNLHSPLQKKFIDIIKKKYNLDFIIKEVEKIKSLKIFLVGETIIDQYIFGEVLGKSGKEPHLVMQQESKKQYLGGAAAIANHLSTFCNKVEFSTIMGNKKEFLSFVKKNLKKNINTNYLFKEESPTILKTRFIDKISNNKLLGLYDLNDNKLSIKLEKKLQNHIKIKAKSADLILISDYGHGLISSKIAKILLSQKKMVCLNAQVNASNTGYHSLRKYKKVNTLIINENELRHEMRNKNSHVEILAKKLSNMHGIKNLVVTRGKYGALILKKNDKVIHCPAFANEVLDKVGAGDAMLAIISLCLKVNIPGDLALFFGSLAGATAVENIGNSKFINKNELLRQVEYLIK